MSPQITTLLDLCDAPLRETQRRMGFPVRDICDIANVRFFKATNRVATATAMQPNDVDPAQAR